MHDWNKIYRQLVAHQIPNSHAIANDICEKGLPFEDILSLLIKKIPFEYITNTVDFFGVTLHVDHNVLIPRPETEILVEKVTKALKGHSELPLNVLDLCTGSGCIAISLKKQFPLFCVSASDFSKEALSIAKKNAGQNHVEIDFRQGDLLDPWNGSKFDVIVCNPPYISKQAYQDLESCVKDVEPMMALTDGADGLSFYRRLSTELKPFLNSNAKVFFEIGFDQREAVLDLFSQKPWQEAICEPDFSSLDRFITVHFSG